MDFKWTLNDQEMAKKGLIIAQNDLKWTKKYFLGVRKKVFEFSRQKYALKKSWPLIRISIRKIANFIVKIKMRQFCISNILRVTSEARTRRKASHNNFTNVQINQTLCLA